ncbi:MAG: DUF2721 domain-containing protein [Smithellaceae bacterium]|nr:DUF2721 domain-containing protein [Smithellaceae bacterium]
MVEISLSSPALLFPAISLLLLAYTNRFLALANLIRGLHKSYGEGRNENIRMQISSLRERLTLIRKMQAYGVISILACTLCMFTILLGWQYTTKVLFVAGLATMMKSLWLSFNEIRISTDALNIALDGLE